MIASGGGIAPSSNCSEGERLKVIERDETLESVTGPQK
jgi:hypothetical protein